MSDIIIRAENVGKRYTLNHQAGGGGPTYRKFSDTLVHAAAAPLRAWQRLKAGMAEKLKTDLSDFQSSSLSAFQQPSSLSAFSKEDFWALKDVSFEVKRGEVLGIIGRNGAGKSTLLKILSRITEPTTGRITLKGRVASLLEVGTGFHPELTGRENIFLNGAILGMKRDEIRAKFDEIVDFAGVEKFLDTPVKRYSSGMYVRLAFAVAAHLEPEILIIDEVLAVGDAEFQKKCLGKMQDVAKGGRTVLFVSHNMGAIKMFCTSSLLLNAGQLSGTGSTESIVNLYASSCASRAWNEGLSKANQFGLSLMKAELIELSSSLPVNTLYFGRSYELLFTVKNEGGPLRAGPVIKLWSIDGELVSSICGPEEGIPFHELKYEEIYAVDLSNLALLPGSYHLSFHIFSDDVHPYLTVENAVSFDVHQAPLGESTVCYRKDHGIFRAAKAMRRLKSELL